MRSNGDAGPSRLATFLDRARFKLRRSLIKPIEVHNGTHVYSFLCEEMEEVGRATTLFVKEKGTVDWIRSEAGPGDVFYDIGANMGLYTIMAASQVGPRGRVYAFEPHTANAYSLMRNVGANGLGEIVDVLCCALADRSGFYEFSYASPRPGSSMSQLESTEPQPATGEGFRELKAAATVDQLLRQAAVRPPDLVKIDVDGIEPAVLAGMDGLLRSEERPRALQVELDADSAGEVTEFMQRRGYVFSQRHDTMAGERLIAGGADPESVAHNVIFRPAATP